MYINIYITKVSDKLNRSKTKNKHITNILTNWINFILIQ